MQSSMISLLCEWANANPCLPVHWTPESFVGSWREGPALFIGDLATFLATANMNAVTTLNINDPSVTELSGLCSLPNLEVLTVTDSAMTTLDVSSNQALQGLIADSTTALSVIDCSGLTSLTLITCQDSAVQTLIADNCPALVSIYCDGGGFVQTISAQNCPSLTTVWGYTNVVTSANFSGSTSLDFLDLNTNQLGTLTITGCFAITYLDISSNPSVTVIGP